MNDKETDISLNGFGVGKDPDQKLTYFWCDADLRGLKYEKEILCLKTDQLLNFPVSQVIDTVREILLRKGIDPETMGIMK